MTIDILEYWPDMSSELRQDWFDNPVDTTLSNVYDHLRSVVSDTGMTFLVWPIAITTKAMEYFPMSKLNGSAYPVVLARIIATPTSYTIVGEEQGAYLGDIGTYPTEHDAVNAMTAAIDNATDVDAG